ncbi:LANO_0F04346g1_1 [Lachancea nothofagi CBS 11611]|uniref:LANO_0F04346g1_1 n=1 Tax=Lachancea nothofagi CBS 11611 TaxID=1266666 RepID=A0A1G4K7I7_9SACH|nr:LANO_0F04346g1_1 [Lachancea nothofagi CBS 11611]
MTWRQFLNEALKKSHGLFGEGCEYYFLNQDMHLAYLKVFLKDAALFSSAIATFISSDGLVGMPMVALILQSTNDARQLQITEDDLLWHGRVIDDETEDDLKS